MTCPEHSYIANAVAALETPADPITAGHLEYQARRNFRDLCRLYGFGPSCGLEFHHAARARYRCDEAPDHLECPLIGEPCWHDGTSLYASETIWPMVEPILRSGDHETVFRLLEHEYDRHFNRLVEDRGAA